MPRLTPILLMLGMSMAMPLMAQAPMSNPEGPRVEAAARTAAALERLNYRPDISGVAGVENQLSGASGVAPETKAKADVLHKQAFASFQAGHLGEAMRTLYQAISLLQGSDWKTDAFPTSLALDLATPVADKGDPLFATLRGMWPELPTSKALILHARVMEDRPGGALVADLGTQSVYSPDYTAAPQYGVFSISSLNPGHYRFMTEVSDGSKTITTLMSPLDIAEGVHVRAAEMKTRLAKVAGHEEAKTVIRYPFSLYRAVNARQREVLNYDYQAQIARSMALLTALEAGHDSFYQATGDSKRAHVFAQAIVPYRLYVPKSWAPGKHLPLVIFLHGANNDDDNSMDRANGLLPKLAEAHNMIVLAPLGYRMNSAYGALLPGTDQDFGQIVDPDPERWHNSEQEVLAVTDEVAKEYGVDAKRIYLSGNSMGGMGTWHLAEKYPERWAAVAPAAGGVNDPTFDYTRLKTMPILAVSGDLDIARWMVETTLVKAIAAGLTPIYRKIPNGTHGSSIETALPEVFDFFAKHRK